MKQSNYLVSINPCSVYYLPLLLLLLLLSGAKIIAAVGIQEVTNLTEWRYLPLLPLGISDASD
jgi:hypothetical protein